MNLQRQKHRLDGAATTIRLRLDLPKKIKWKKKIRKTPTFLFF
jgi:hypothetical protein